MGFIREQFGRVTVESRRESFMIHVEDASLREPSSEWWTSDLDDLIAALVDYRASLGPASGGGNGVDTPPPNPYAGHECDQHRGRPAASPADERLREALAGIEAALREKALPFTDKRLPTYVLGLPDVMQVVRAALAGVSAEATGVWPDQSAQHAVLLEQIKDAYAEGKADAVALIRERAALALPDLARFTLDEVEAIVGLSAEAAPEPLPSTDEVFGILRGYQTEDEVSADAAPDALRDCYVCGRPQREHAGGVECDTPPPNPSPDEPTRYARRGFGIASGAPPVMSNMRAPEPEGDNPAITPPSNPYPFHEPLRVEHHSDEDKRQAWDEGYAAGVVAGRSIPSTGTGWDRGYAAGLAARDTQDGECRAPHCWSEYGTPCGTCPKEKR